MSTRPNLPALATAFFNEWAECSKEMLKVLAPKCPSTPRGKTRPWEDDDGPLDGPIGLLLHYTGGPNGVASIRWGNENPANTGSSWHCTVFDHIIGEVADIHLSFPLVAAHLSVTAILHADITAGTWHGNWTNSRTFGLENRNLGLLSESGGQIYRAAGSKRYYPRTDKQPVLIRGQWWEPYTREQLETNIAIGRMLAAWRGEAFQPGWVLPHQFIKASKSDTGSAYPMAQVRASIFSGVPIGEIGWLKHYEAAAGTVFEDDDEGLEYDLDRGIDDEPEKFPMTAVDFDKIDGTGWRDYLPAVRRNLGLLGGYCPHPGLGVEETELDSALRLAADSFQKSTHDPKYPGKALKVDGVPGGSTCEEIERRLRKFGHDV